MMEMNTHVRLDQAREMRSAPAAAIDAILALNNRGIGSFEQGDFDNSKCCFLEALRGVGMGQVVGIIDSALFDEISRECKSIAIYPEKAHGNDVNSRAKPLEYDEGMHKYNKPIRIDERYHQHTLLPTLAYNMAQAVISRGGYNAAKCWLRLAARYHEATASSDSMLEVRILQTLGYCFYKTASSDMSLACYQQALDVIRKYKLGDEYLAVAFNCIGVIHFDMEIGDTDKAKQSLEQSLQIHRSTSSTNQLDMATVLNNLGRVYYLRSEFEDARKAYAECLRIRKRFLSNDSLDLGAIYYNLAQVLFQLRNMDDAMVNFQDFVSIASIHFGENSKDVGQGFKGIAEVYQEQENLEASLCFFTKALTAHTTSCGIYSQEVATLLNKLGNLNYKMQDFDTAMRNYRDGLEIERRVLSPNHLHLIITQTNIAHIHRQLGQHQDARNEYKRVLMMQIEAFGEDGIQLAETHACIGLMCSRMEDNENTVKSYQAALRVYRHHYGTNEHPNIASTLNSIGLALFKQGVFELAKACFSEGLRIRSKLLGSNHPDVAILWYNGATVCAELGDEDEAIAMYKEALRVEKCSLGNDHPDVVLTLQHLGQLFQQLGRIEQSIGYYEEAISITRDPLVQKSGELGKLLNLLGNAYLQLGQVKQMMECYTEASRISQDSEQLNAEENLVIAGFGLYSFSKVFIPSAPVA
ncbi:unnamed protein product [Cylindrotheca closterium]|uniref:Kinesin light chain n=1 Tax=Cylindrotheca closterium TaxID=2856 RepID=A0AAD2G3Z6_9STRA|nr:unnamed protein product [Cylindrotheca closterium]